MSIMITANCLLRVCHPISLQVQCRHAVSRPQTSLFKGTSTKVMGCVAPDLKHSDHCTISVEGAKEIEADTGAEINYLSSTEDVEHDSQQPHRPIVINTLKKYFIKAHAPRGSGHFDRDMPFLEAAQLLFVDFFDNHLLEHLSSPWAMRDAVRKIIAANIGFNSTQGQAWDATYWQSEPGLCWRKIGLSESIRKILGLFAVLGSGLFQHTPGGSQQDPAPLSLLPPAMAPSKTTVQLLK